MRISNNLLTLALAILVVTGTVSCKEKETSTPNDNGRTTAAADSASGDIDNNPAQPSENLKPQSQNDMTRGDLRRLSDSLQIGVSGGTDLTYRVGNTEVKVKKIVPENGDDLVNLFDAVFLDSGNVDAVLLAEDGVYRVISDNPDAGKAVVASFDDLAPLQDVKINPFVLGDTGNMISDAVVDSDGVDEISRSLNLGIDAVLNQFVDLNGRRVQINFLLPGNNATTEEVLSKLIEEKGSELGLYIFGDAVIEMPGVNEETARTVWDLINGGR
jgi:hypothetical protein